MKPHFQGHKKAKQVNDELIFLSLSPKFWPEKRMDWPHRRIMAPKEHFLKVSYKIAPYYKALCF